MLKKKEWQNALGLYVLSWKEIYGMMFSKKDLESYRWFHFYVSYVYMCLYISKYVCVYAMCMYTYRHIYNICVYICVTGDIDIDV